MSKIKIWFFLGLIIILALFIRIYKIDSLPLGVHPDEASWGYNAFSILKSGKDEHAINYPLIFRAFGDQKLPVFTYSLIPFIAISGLNNFAVRLPAAIAGLIFLLVLYLILKRFKFSTSISLIGVFIATTSPWLIFLNRVFGYDSMFGLMFYSLGIYFFLVAQEKKQTKFFILSAVSFALTWYSYIAYRLITPLTLLSLVFVFYKPKQIINKNTFLTGIFFTILISPLLYLSFFGTGTARLNQVFSTPVEGMIMRINENRFFCTQQLPRILCNLNDNKLESYSQTVFYRYVKTFSPEYLFLEGDKESKFLNVENYGLFYWFLIPIYLFGFFYFFSKSLNKKITKLELLVLLNLLITPISAALVEEPSKVRLSALFLFLIIFLCYGLTYLHKLLTKSQYKIGFISIIWFINGLFAIFFLIDLFTIHFHKNEIYYQNHNTKLIQYLGKQNPNYPIYIRSIDEGIVLYAYLNKIDPTIFQTRVIREPLDQIGFAHASDLLNIHLTNLSVKEIYCLEKNQATKVLYTTNENLINPQYFTKAQKVIYSENRVHKLQFVYNLKDLRHPENFVCD